VTARFQWCCPALNEEETVGEVVASVQPLLGSLVDELVVVDSGSTDATAELAAGAGARVVYREDVLPELTPSPGKGEVLWRSLAATSGDLVVFLDSDLVERSSCRLCLARCFSPVACIW
jgi:glucosyl-3-phosphoglycerate synthase